MNNVNNCEQNYDNCKKNMTFEEAQKKVMHILYGNKYTFDEAETLAMKKAIWALSYVDVELALYKLLMKEDTDD